MNRNDLQALSTARLIDAEALFAAGHYPGTYYLAGYAAECALKACVARGVQLHEFPDRDKVNQSFTHDLAKLAKVAGLEGALQANIAANQVFAANWAVVKEWSESTRYSLDMARQDAEDLLTALSDPANGVLPWLTAHW